METNGIDIEQIMQEIREEAKRIEYTEPIAFEQVRVPQTARLKQYLPYLQNAIISYYRPLEGNIVKRFLKKVIRKLLKFLVEPITIEVNSYCAQNAAQLTIMSELLEAQEKEITVLRSRITILEAERAAQSSEAERAEK